MKLQEQKARVAKARQHLDETTLLVQNVRRMGLGRELLEKYLDRQENAILALENEMDYLAILKEQGAVA